MSEIAKYRQSEEAAWNLLDAERQATKRLREQVAAQAAVIEKLWDALSNCLVEHPNKPFVHLATWRVKEALAIPTDSTQILDEVRRAERERVYQVADNAYATEHVLLAIRAME